jgi:hypothetical protein
MQFPKGTAMFWIKILFASVITIGVIGASTAAEPVPPKATSATTPASSALVPVAKAPPPLPLQQIAAKLEAKNVVIALGDKAHFRAIVTDAKGQPVAGADVSFYVQLEGKEHLVGQAKSGANGLAEDYVYKPLIHLEPGTFVTVSKVMGKPSSSTIAGLVAIEAKSNLAILKSSVILKTVAQLLPGQKKAKVTAGLVRSTDNAPINGRYVNVTMFGQIKALATNAEGWINLDFDVGANSLTKKVTVTATFDGDNFYAAGGGTFDIPSTVNYDERDVRITVIGIKPSFEMGQQLEFQFLVEDISGGTPVPINNALVVVDWQITSVTEVGKGWHNIYQVATGANGKTPVWPAFNHAQAKGAYPVSVHWRPADKSYLNLSTVITEAHIELLNLKHPATINVGETAEIEVIFVNNRDHQTMDPRFKVALSYINTKGETIGVESLSAVYGPAKFSLPIGKDAGLGMREFTFRSKSSSHVLTQSFKMEVKDGVVYKPVTPI